MWPWIVAALVVLLVVGAVYLEFFAPRAPKRRHDRDLSSSLNHEVHRAHSDNIRNQSTGL